jgi:alpha(1,3/1,4) fucosyltransferase
LISGYKVPFNATESAGFILRSFMMDLEDYRIEHYKEDVYKVILLNDFSSQEAIRKLPKEKLVLTLWEPDSYGPKSDYWKLFSRVYTHNDNWMYANNAYRLNHPTLMPMIENIPTFHEKKFCTIVFQNPKPNRLKMVNFFESKKNSGFDFYGKCPKKIVESSCFRGPIPGIHSDTSKIDVISQYKFYICFENTCIPGYITEKLMNCFTAGCVPIYLGAPNVTSYIPKGCFIDYRDFSSNEEMYQFLKNMTENEYEVYLQNIREFIVSPQGQSFSRESFDDLVLDIALH